MSKPKVIAIVGPTASGKTSLSIEIAKKCDGEVISADSRQVYKGLDIGTGKVTQEEMGDIPHHLIDIHSPEDVYTASDFKRDAAACIEKITGRNHVPIIAGGTFFYLDILRGKMQAAPVEPNEDFRNSLAHFKDDELYSQLRSKDPKRAESIDPFNRRRLERALEIIEALGSVPPETQTESPYEWLVIGIETDKTTLHENIHTRLLHRLDQGMVAEVEALLAQGVPHERLFNLGLEYRYIDQYLQKNINYDDMVQELETKIKQFSKRQLTWLKKDPEIEWFSAEKRADILKRVREFLA